MHTFTTYLLIAREDIAFSLKNLLHYLQFSVPPVIFHTPGVSFQESPPPDLLLLDGSFHNILPLLQEKWPLTRCIALTVNEPEAAEALFAGAQHYVLHTDHPEILPAVIMDVMLHNTTASLKNIVRHLRLKDETPAVVPAAVASLTNKEREILILLRQGVHLREIARQTGASYETIRTHIKKVYKKLDVGSAAEAILKVIHIKL
jgi:DNA-binding NarL/FixJ family response regulator